MIIVLKKYQLWLLSLLSGLLMGLAWPVNGFTPLIFIAWVPLLFVRDYVRNNPQLFSRGAMVLYSYVTFIVFNLFTTWWVSYSTIEGGIIAFVFNTLFMALTFGFAHIIDKYLFKKRTGFFILIFFWLAYEYLHMNWDLTWSWLNMGNVFSEHPSWVQWYSITGTMGGTAWVIAVNLFVFAILDKVIISRKKLKPIFLSVIGLVVLIVLPFIWSNNIANSKNTDNWSSVNVLLLQPNIEPYTEAYALSSEELMTNVLELTRNNIDETTELVITPESTIERSMWENKIFAYPVIDSLVQFVNKNPQLSFLMGASTRRELSVGEEVKSHAREFRKKPGKFYYRYNSAFFYKKNKKIEFYHKAKLVPGVERLPFISVFKYFESLAINLGGTTGSLDVSTEPKVFDFGDGRKVAPIICYESIYGELVGKFNTYGSGFIAVITNDAWWFNSPGHKQHFSYARLRAIENNQYVVRAANTGTTGVIDNNGNVLESTEFYTKTAVKAKVLLNNKPTYYAINGDYLAKLSLFMIALMLIIAISKKLRKE